MNTKELIEKLQDLDQGLDVQLCVRYKNGDYTHIESFSDISVGIIYSYDPATDNDNGKPVFNSLSIDIDDESVIDFHHVYEIAEFGEQDEEE